MANEITSNQFNAAIKIKEMRDEIAEQAKSSALSLKEKLAFQRTAKRIDTAYRLLLDMHEEESYVGEMLTVLEDILIYVEFGRGNRDLEKRAKAIVSKAQNT